MTSIVDFVAIPQTVSRDYTASGPMLIKWVDAATVEAADGPASIPNPGMTIDLLPGEDKALDPARRKYIVQGSVLFTFNGKTFFDRNGSLYTDFNPATGAATACGTIDYQTGLATVTSYGSGSNVVIADPVILGCLSRIPDVMTSFVRFRTPAAPIRPQSLSVRATTLNGALLNGASQSNGDITGTKILGSVNYDTGIVDLNFGEELNDNDNAPSLTHRTEPWYSAEVRYNVGTVPAPDYKTWRPTFVDPASILYNVVTYSFLPLDAALIGLNPVRLPSDGRVPIFKDGYVLVIHDTAFQTLPNSLTPGQVVTLARGDLAEVILRDQNGLDVNSALFTVARAAGTITMANPLNLAGYAQPLIAEHRIEDMVLCTDSQINGELSLSRALIHDYTAANSFVSSALLFGDLQARVSKFFDQASWASVWSDTLSGSAAAASFNDVTYPLTVTNAGTITERWALVFTTQTAFNIIGENVGQIGTGSTSVDCAPINPVTGVPYFSLNRFGWGAGWSAGNVLRINTTGNIAPIWFARTTKQSTSDEMNDNVRIQIRGDAD